MSRLLVTGGAGMLAHDLVPLAAHAGHDVRAVDRAELDITDAAAVVDAVAGADVVVNCAAWTAVDDAESHEPEAFAVNAVGAANLARAARLHGARMVQVSTDYVFSGEASDPYPVDAPIAPQSAYGRTKAAGEWAVRAECPQHYVVRTAWLYGAGGRNFVSTMARLAGERDTLTVVDDQTGSPTWTADLARQILALLAADAPYGTYHGTNGGSTTWFGFARAIFALLGHDPDRVRPVDSTQFVQAAARPAWSVLDQGDWEQAGIAPLRGWQDALGEAVPVLFPDSVVSDSVMSGHTDSPAQPSATR